MNAAGTVTDANDGDVAGISGATFQMFAHGIMTALFFSATGYIYDKTHYKTIPDPILRQVRKRLSKPLWQTALEFTRRFGLAEIIAQVESLEAE